MMDDLVQSADKKICENKNDSNSSLQGHKFYSTTKKVKLFP
jgi:hypothetical protein